MGSNYWTLAATVGLDAEDELDRMAIENAEQGDALRRALVAARRAANLTQHEVAERMGVGQSAVAKFESGRRSPRLETIERYLVAVEAKIDYLLNGEPVVDRQAPHVDFVMNMGDGDRILIEMKRAPVSVSKAARSNVIAMTDYRQMKWSEFADEVPESEAMEPAGVAYR